MAFSSLLGLSMGLFGAVWDHRPRRASPWKPSFGFSVGSHYAFLQGCRRVGLDGEGLGGGYCTPPNRTRCERSELAFRGVWGEAPDVKVIHRSPCVLLKRSVKKVLRKKKRQQLFDLKK